MKILTIAFLTLLALSLTANATTYYISTSGNDSANGTSKVTPWAHCPGMKTFTGSYSHAAGDRFIFKGGETWLAANFPMKINVGGSSDSVRDYYGTDQTWFAGVSFSRALFDFQDTVFGVNQNGAAIQFTTGAWYILFGDGLDLTRHRAVTGYGNMTIAFTGSDYVRVTNIVVRNWSQAMPVAAGADQGGALGWFGGGGGTSIEILNSTLHQDSATGGYYGGVAINGIGTVRFCEIRNTASGMTGSWKINDNYIHDLVNPSDPTKHSCAIITYSGVDIHNNIITGMNTDHAPIELNASQAPGADSLIYNNLIYNAGGQTPCYIICDSTAFATQSLRVYNNTFEHGNGYCVMVEDHGSGVHLGTLDVRNNHLITSGTAVAYRPAVNDPGLGYVDNAIVGNNLIQTPAQANSAGYTIANQYAPTSTVSPTVGVGLNLSAIYTSSLNGVTRTVPWDDGAYQFTTASSNGSILWTVSTASVSETTPSITATAIRVSGSSGTVGAPYATADGTATSGQNYTSRSGVLTWPNGDSSPKTVVIPILNAGTLGTKQFSISLSSPTGGATLGAPSTQQITIVGSGAPPNTPTNLTPASGASGVSLTPSCSISGYSDPQGRGQTGFQGQILDSVTLLVVYDTGTLGAVTSFSVPPSTLAYSKSYSLHARVQNTLGLWSSYSPLTTFTTLDGLPQAPSNLTPPNGAVNLTLTPTLTVSSFVGTPTWSGSQFQVFSGAVVIWDSGVLGPVTSTTVAVNTLTAGTTYSWRARFQNQVGWGPLSAATTFTTGSAPSTPTNLTPPNGALNTILAPNFKLSAYSSTLAQVSAQIVVTFNGGPVWDSGQLGVTDNATIPVGLLTYSHTYGWSGRFLNAQGWSAFSANTLFSTTNSTPIPPPAPPISSNVVLIIQNPSSVIIQGGTIITNK